MNTVSTRKLCIVGAFVLLPILWAPQLYSQTPVKNGPSVVEGKVQDSQNGPVAGAVISLEGTDLNHTVQSTSNSKGQFHFTAVTPGTYTLRAKLAGYQECLKGPFVVDDHDTKSFVLLLAKSGPSNDAMSSIPFSDEPSFTVAGVTDTPALGGHGSGPIMRAGNALSKETASLAASSPPASTSSSAPGAALAAREAALRTKLAHEENADLRAQLAEIEETEGHPLDAVGDYQRAAEMQPTEPHLFAWGAELLLHHAAEPAIEVFAKGHRLYPQSSRMMLGLGAAQYSERSSEKAVRIFMEASDLNPADPTPYLFLGSLQVTEQELPPGWADRMKRFVTLHPDNAVAHYLHAMSIIKSREPAPNLATAEAELNAAVKLDPRLGDAYLQLGILRMQRPDFPGAIDALQKAVETTPFPEEAHYRLAQVYRHLGNTEKASREVAEYQKLTAQRDEQAERERHEIPQFVYTLRSQSPAPATPSPE
jgi:tetratricopeptide (TPR) repeat protein